MSSPVLQLDPVGEARRTRVAREAFALVGWGVAGAGVAAVGCAGGLGIGWLWMGPAVLDLMPESPLSQSVAVSMLLAGAGGLPVGAIAGAPRAREDRGGAVLELGVFAAGVGALFGLLTPLLAVGLRGALLAGESQVLAFAIVGLLAGVVGRISSGSRSLFVAVGWGVAGAVAGGGAWGAALLLVRLLPGPDVVPVVPADHRIEAALLVAVVGGTWGLVVGGAMGLLRGGADRSGAALRWGLGAAAVGVVGGGACLPLVLATRGVLAPEASSSLAWALAGLLAGLVAYGLSRPAVSDVEIEDEWLDGEPRPAREPRGVRAVGPGPISRLLPVVAVSGGCLVAVVVAPPSELGWAMLAVGLLGLAVAWALVGQERRVRELEERIRRR